MRKKRNTPQTTMCILALMLYSYVGLAQAAKKQLVSCRVAQLAEVTEEKVFTIDLLLDIQRGWYIYAPTGTNSSLGMIETKVAFILPRGIEKVGKVKIPEPAFKNGYEIYEGNGVVISQALKVLPSMPSGEYNITARITWQTCSSESCLPPVTEEIVTTIHYKQTPN